MSRCLRAAALFVSYVCCHNQQLTLVDNTFNLSAIPSTINAQGGLQIPKIYGVALSVTSTFYLNRIDLGLVSGTGN